MPISYTWEQVGQGGVVLSTEESFTLMVANASQYGMYRCTATNILGSDSGTVDVVQACKSIEIVRELKICGCITEMYHIMM